MKNVEKNSLGEEGGRKPLFFRKLRLFLEIKHFESSLMVLVPA